MRIKNGEVAGPSGGENGILRSLAEVYGKLRKRSITFDVSHYTRISLKSQIKNYEIYKKNDFSVVSAVFYDQMSAHGLDATR